MDSKFQKFNKDQVFSINSIKGGLTIGGKSATTTTKTIETGNDLDSARDIENDKKESLPFE